MYKTRGHNNNKPNFSSSFLLRSYLHTQTTLFLTQQIAGFFGHTTTGSGSQKPQKQVSHKNEH